NPAALQNWLRVLAQPAGLTAWLGHFAGLIGAEGIPITGDGSPDNPFAAQVLSLNAQSGVSITVSLTPDAIRFGARASLLPAGANPPGRIDADAVLASIPLHGTASASVLPSLRVAFRAPGTIGGAKLVDSAQIKVGSALAGIEWDGS